MYRIKLQVVSCKLQEPIALLLRESQSPTGTIENIVREEK